MRQADPPRPRKRPKQSRSSMLVKAIEEACLQILENEGPDQLTTQRIADVAGVNIASLYQYFPNKEAVLAEVFDEKVQRYTESARQRILEIDQLSRTSFEETLRAIIGMEVDQRRLLQQMDADFYRVYQHSFDVHRRVNELTVSMDNGSRGFSGTTATGSGRKIWRRSAAWPREHCWEPSTSWWPRSHSSCKNLPLRRSCICCSTAILSGSPVWQLPHLV